MLHGVLGRPAHFAPLFPQLPRGCRAAALHLPLFEDHGPTNIGGLADFAADYLARHTAEPAVIMGNSIGGHVALTLALRHPERVAGLVLAGSSGLLERSFKSLPGMRPSREWLGERVREVFFHPSHATDELIDAVCAVINNPGHARRLVSLFRSARGENMAPQLPAIKCPVLVAWGRQDNVTPPEAAAQFCELLPDSELAWFDECGHVPMLERPGHFGAALRDWWRRRILHCAAGAVAQCACPACCTG
jgi:2-hydroxy-6-oxonona-2,4-dienedioate hydrolase